MSSARAVQPPATGSRIAFAVGVASAIALVVSGVAAQSSGIRAPIVEDGAFINLAAGPTFPLLAALLLREGGRTSQQNRLAWLFVGLGVLCTGTDVVFTVAALGLQHHAGWAPGVAWVESWLWTSVVPGISLLLLWFPSGAVVGPRWRWAVRAAVAADLCLWVAAAFAPGRNLDFSIRTDNPWGSVLPAGALAVVGTLARLLVAGAFLASVASLGVRYRRGDPQVRAQLRWLIVSVAVIVLTIALPAPSSLRDAVLVVNVLATVLLPLTLAVALTRAGFALPRLLVYGLLSTVLLLAYIAVVGAADTLLGTRADRAAALVAAGLVTVLVAPLRARLQRSVDRLVYGDRGDPHTALSQLGRRIAASPDDVLAEVVGTVADALRSPYVALVLADESDPAASVGTPAPSVVTIPLTLRHQQVGRLLVANRAPREQYGERDLSLLHDLARHVAVAAHAAALTRDLQRSRESLVIAREEERRRIRRDLHDGLGPALAGVAFGLDAARNTLRRDPETTDASLAQLKSEVQASLTDVRRLVYDLRPPALDQLGLVPALEEYAARLRERSALDITVTPVVLPVLPAAVEVAAYRIATEALNNAVRHSSCRRTAVTFAVHDHGLRLEVADDGVGVPAVRLPGASGVGLATMLERAAELGGTCRVAPRAGGGTTVVADLPLRAVVS